MDLCDAINNRRVIRFTYDGLPREVLPAAYGPHVKTRKLSLRGYQIAGQSSSRVPPLWDLFTVKKIVGLEVTEDTFEDDPPGYRQGRQGDC